MNLTKRNPTIAIPIDNAVSGMFSINISIIDITSVVIAVTSEPMHWFIDVPRVSTSLVTRLMMSPLEDRSK